MRIKVHRSAKVDLLDARLFYEEQQEGLGDYFSSSLCSFEVFEEAGETVRREDEQDGCGKDRCGSCDAEGERQHDGRVVPDGQGDQSAEIEGGRCRTHREGECDAHCKRSDDALALAGFLCPESDGRQMERHEVEQDERDDDEERASCPVAVFLKDVREC